MSVIRESDGSEYTWYIHHILKVINQREGIG